MNGFKIRHALPEDLSEMLRIFSSAREFMARTGNPNQWGPRAWPPEVLLRRDIEQGGSYVCCRDGKTVKVRTYSPLFGISKLTRHLANRTEPYDQFDFSIEE